MSYEMLENLQKQEDCSNQSIQIDKSNSDADIKDMRKLSIVLKEKNNFKRMETKSLKNNKADINSKTSDASDHHNNISPLVSPNIDFYLDKTGNKVTFGKIKPKKNFGIIKNDDKSSKSGSYKTGTSYYTKSVTKTSITYGSNIGLKQAKKRNRVEEAIDYAPMSTHHEIVFPFNLEKATFDIKSFKYYYSPQMIMPEKNFYSFKNASNANIIMEENENEEIEDFDGHVLMQNDLILYSEIQTVIEDQEQIKYYDPIKIKTPVFIYPLMVLLVVVCIVGLTLLSLYASNSRDIMMAFVTSLVMLSVFCTVILTCVSKNNNKKYTTRDENIRRCLDKWNKDVFLKKDAKIVSGKLSAWLVLQIEEEHFLRNFC